jgi:hypothetical protein
MIMVCCSSAWIYLFADEYIGLVKIDGDKVTKLTDFDNLKKQILAVKPTSVEMNSYTPINTKLQQCPVEGNDWRASSKLPPSPNQQLCTCMVNSLTCVAKSSVDKSKYGDLFSFTCGKGTDCTGINGNGTTGAYGAYSMCGASERLSWAMNAVRLICILTRILLTFPQYYDAQNKASTACDFNGDGQTQTPTSASGACATLLKEAGGTKGTGTVTSAPTSSSSSTSSASSAPIPSIWLGSYKIASAMVVAFFGGVAMII